jgi:meiotically up-regulated gene 157 (Mug157) protein
MLKSGDDEYRQPMSNFTEYERCQEGSSWVLEVDGFGSVNAMTPAQ